MATLGRRHCVHDLATRMRSFPGEHLSHLRQLAEMATDACFVSLEGFEQPSPQLCGAAEAPSQVRVEPRRLSCFHLADP